MNLAVLVPVLNRPHNVTPFIESLFASTPGLKAKQVLFITDPHDTEERAAILSKTSCLVLDHGGNYATKINAGVGQLRRDWKPRRFFLAADDLRFREGWLEAAEEKVSEGAQVVGINDLIRRHREHATHFLLTDEYAELPCIDGSRGPLFEGYDHSCVDDELIATATKRGAYAYAQDSHVEHLHPDVGTAEWDGTYRKGREHMKRDLKLMRLRSHLWR